MRKRGSHRINDASIVETSTRPQFITVNTAQIHAEKKQNKTTIKKEYNDTGENIIKHNLVQATYQPPPKKTRT